MKDPGNASFVLDIYIEIVLGVFLDCQKKGYIEKFLKRYGMQYNKPGDTPMAKGHTFSLNQST